MSVYNHEPKDHTYSRSWKILNMRSEGNRKHVRSLFLIEFFNITDRKTWNMSEVIRFIHALDSANVIGLMAHKDTHIWAFHNCEFFTFKRPRNNLILSQLKCTAKAHTDNLKIVASAVCHKTKVVISCMMVKQKQRIYNSNTWLIVLWVTNG